MGMGAYCLYDLVAEALPSLFQHMRTRICALVPTCVHGCNSLASLVQLEVGGKWLSNTERRVNIEVCFLASEFLRLISRYGVEHLIHATH